MYLFKNGLCVTPGCSAVPATKGGFSEKGEDFQVVRIQLVSCGNNQRTVNNNLQNLTPDISWLPHAASLQSSGELASCTSRCSQPRSSSPPRWCPSRSSSTPWTAPCRRCRRPSPCCCPCRRTGCPSLPCVEPSSAFQHPWGKAHCQRSEIYALMNYA